MTFYGVLGTQCASQNAPHTCTALQSRRGVRKQATSALQISKREAKQGLLLLESFKNIQICIFFSVDGDSGAI